MPGYIQGNTNTVAPGASLTISLTGVATGSLLVLAISTSGAGTSISTVSDGVNTWTRRSGRTFVGSGGGCETWEANNVTGGNLTVTVTPSGTVNILLAIAEYSGPSASPFDKQASTSGTSASPNSGATTTTAQADEILVGVISQNSAGGTISPGSGYTLRQSSAAAGGLILNLMDQTVSATGTYSADATMVSSQWVSQITTYKTAAAASSTSGLAVIAQQQLMMAG